jgi:PAS domain S-box-containing protein
VSPGRPLQEELEALRRRVDDLTIANDGLKREVAELARIESELRASELGVRLLVDAIPALILVLSPSGDVEHANQQAVNYFGRTIEEIVDTFREHLIHPHDRGLATNVLARSIASGDPFDIQLRLRRFDDVHRWFQARGLPIRDVTGHVEHWYVVVSDIDQRKRSEDELRVRELGVRLLVDTVEALPALAIVANEVGEIIFANRQVLDYYGRTLEEVKQFPTSAHIVHPDDLEHANRVIAGLVVTGMAGRDEYRLRRYDGVYRWFEGRYSPLKDEEGRVINWYVILVDIDDRKQSEERLRQSEAFLAEAQRLSSTGGFRWRVGTDQTVWSEQLGRIFGFDQTTPPGLEPFRSRFHPHDLPAVDEIIDRARSAGQNFESEHRLLMPDGSVKFVRLVAHADHGRDGQLEYVGAVQDVTRQKVAEETLSEVRSDLARVTRVMSLGAVTASIAHEVSQPLSGIVVNAGACLRMLAANPPNIAGATDTARRTLRDANRASDVVARLRALFSKTETTVDFVDLNEAAREVTALASGELRRGGIVVRTDFAEGLPAVRGDRVQLQQVVLNLILNATQAMSNLEDRPRELTIAIAPDTDGHVRVSVRDVGAGVDPDTVERLFQPFHTTKAGGMGVGLTVSRSIIEAHGGTILATNNQGPGATFAFTLPAAAHHRHEGATSRQAESPGAE